MMGHYELDVMRAAVQQMTRWIGDDPIRDRAMIDVGGNMGTTTVPAVREFGAARVVAIEPNARNVKILSANVLLNDIADRVTVVHAAAADEEGEVELEVSDKSVGDHRVRRPTSERAEMGEDERTTVKVAARTIDAIAAETIAPDTPIGLIWMDVQGYEGHALAGATETIGRGVPVLIEYWPYGLKRAGGLELLHTIMEERFSRVIDVRGGADGREIPRPELAALPDRFPGFNDYTDLLLIP